MLKIPGTPAVIILIAMSATQVSALDHRLVTAGNFPVEISLLLSADDGSHFYSGTAHNGNPGREYGLNVGNNGRWTRSESCCNDQGQDHFDAVFPATTATGSPADFFVAFKKRSGELFGWRWKSNAGAGAIDVAPDEVVYPDGETVTAASCTERVAVSVGSTMDRCRSREGGVMVSSFSANPGTCSVSFVKLPEIIRNSCESGSFSGWKTVVGG